MVNVLRLADTLTLFAMDSFQSIVKFVPIHNNGLNIKEIICALALESLFTTGNKELTFIGGDNPTEVTVVKE